MNEIYTVAPDSATQTPQLRLELAEPARLYHIPLEVTGAKFALCSKLGDGKVSQDFFPVEKLDWAMRQIERMPKRDQTHFWISQATLRPSARNRRISSIMLLNAAWVDIDLSHPPPKFIEAGLKAPGGNIDALAELLVQQIVDAGLPAPTMIVATGGGLCPKWIFESAIPSHARSRWQSLQQHLVQRLGELRIDQETAWPVDAQASDAARILRLVGTVNPRWGTQCRIVWDGGQQLPFEFLADEILPYTRDQVQSYMARKSEWASFDWNRAQAAANGIRPSIVGSLAMSEEAGRTLWTGRFEFARSLLDLRGGVAVGHRNNLFWVIGNALAHSCSSVDNLKEELAALHHSYFKVDSWTRGQAFSSAGSVMSRLPQGKDKLYKMTTKTFLNALEVSQAELAALRAEGIEVGGVRSMNKASWKVGAMGFERMKGLSFDAYLAETRARQAQAGRQIGAENLRAAAQAKASANAEKRLKALEMGSKGMSTRQVSEAIGVNQSTVSRWLKQGDA